MKINLINGDCLEEMKKMESNSIDCIITDPPYGLSFMGKKWDKEVPSVEYWQEMLRICKAGSFLLASGAPRSHHHLAMAIENAGWEITDCIMHLFGSGFPKGKSQLKPAYEPWILARKKADKVKHLNIDDCRIPTEENLKSGRHFQNKRAYPSGYKDINRTEYIQNQKGRWPSNIILGDEEVEKMLNEQSGILKTGSMKPQLQKGDNTIFKRKYSAPNGQIGSEGYASRFFYCAKASQSERNKGLEGMPLKNLAGSNKFTDCDYRKGNGEITAKGHENHHPTVKPLKLMEYLIKLVMPKEENAVLFEPFMGSGSTLIACKNLGVNCIGIELNTEYFEIAKKRIESGAKDQPELF